MTQKAGSKQQQQLYPDAHILAVGALLLGALKVHQAWPTQLSYQQGEGMCSASPTSPTDAENGSRNPCSLRAPVTVVLPDTLQAPQPAGL